MNPKRVRTRFAQHIGGDITLGLPLHYGCGGRAANRPGALLPWAGGPGAPTPKLGAALCRQGVDDAGDSQSLV
jgi:hypothetical protein